MSQNIMLWVFQATHNSSNGNACASLVKRKLINMKDHKFYPKYGKRHSHAFYYYSHQYSKAMLFFSYQCTMVDSPSFDCNKLIPPYHILTINLDKVNKLISKKNLCGILTHLTVIHIPFT